MATIRTAGLALRVLILAPALALLLVPTTPALGGNKRWRDDQIPFGPEGTIGRGTDSAADPPYNVRGGIPLFTFSRGDWGVGSSGGRSSAPALPGSYLTNQYLEPGDGYRYPLYYNPATRTYFYYPAPR